MNRKIITAIVLVWLSYAMLASSATMIPAPPVINATSYLVADYHSGQNIIAHNSQQRVEPASLTKIMTVYVVASELAEGHITLDDKVSVSERAWRMEGSRMFIEVGKKVAVSDLLKGVIIQSGNDASVALAEHVSGDEGVFAVMMNQHAARLGMTGTHFVNSTGLPDPQHYTTAADMATLAAALFSDFPDIYALHAVKEFTFNNIKQNNRNSLLWKDDSVDGIKTGHTEAAGYCLVASARRGEMRLISVIMGTEGNHARTRASQALLNYVFRFYETRPLFRAGDVITTGRLWKGERESVNLGLRQDLIITLPKGEYKDLQTTAALPENIIAPVSQDQPYGDFKVVLAGEQIASRGLVALESVAEGGLLTRMLDTVTLWFE